MKKPVSIAFALGAGLFTGFLILVVVFQVMGFTYSNSVMFESCQGDYVKYNSYDPYCFYIIKQSLPLSSQYVILVSRKGDKEYGHVLNYIDTVAPNEEHLKKTRVIWSDEGIEVTFPAGHKLYIPKDKFIGGR